MDNAFFDNRTNILKDDLVRIIKEGDTVSVAASVFSMYAFNELREQLELLDEFRFIYTEPTFAKERAKKEQREFYIPRLSNSANINVGTTADTFTFTRDGDNWTIQGSNGTYFNGKAGAFTGWSGPHPYKVYTFRTAPYYSITYTCTRDGRYSVGLGTYTFYVAAGQPYTLECPVDAPNGYRYVTCSEKQTSGIMTKNLEVTYDFTRRPVDVGIDAIENGQAGDKAWYDLSGRRVSNPQKGVYIHQGKKVVLP